MPINFNPFDEPIAVPIGPDGDPNDAVMEALRRHEQQMREARRIAENPGGGGFFLNLGQVEGNAPRRGARIEAPRLRVPKTGTELFIILLNAVREVYEIDGFVSGGAIRDTGMGLPYKDVDLFLPLTMKEFEPHVEELGWQVRGRIAPKNYLNGKTERFQCVSNDQLIDIVLYGKSDVDPVDEFPCHWTRARYTLDNGLQVTPEFTRDMENKTCTMKDGLEPKLRDILIKKFEEWQKRTGLKDWKLEVEGLDKNWFQKYNAERALKAKKKVKTFTTTTTDGWGPLR